MKVTETKTTIIQTINAAGPCYGLVSIVPSATARCIDLVIGARYNNQCACGFTKEGLGDLIKILQEVHDAMYAV